MNRGIDLFSGARGACWTHLPGDNGNGYRRFSVEGRMTYAHRWTYELLRGPIPEGMTLDHLCRNRACGNPWHLEPVPNAVNILRGESPPALNARKATCPLGHAYRMTPNGHRRCDTCNRQRKIDSGEINGRGLPGERTHCPSGHAYDDENTYLVLREDGSVKNRQCRECSRQRCRARRAAAKAAS